MANTAIRYKLQFIICTFLLIYAKKNNRYNSSLIYLPPLIICS